MGRTATKYMRIPTVAAVITLVITVVGLGLSSGDAQAQDPGKKPGASDGGDAKAVKRAKELFLKGSDAARRGDSLLSQRKKKRARKAYARAAKNFLRAYAASPNPYFLFSLGEVYRARGDEQWALACYRRLVALRDTLDESKSGRAARDSLPDARRHIAKLKRKSKRKGDPKIEPAGACTQLPPPEREKPEPVEIIEDPGPPPVPDRRDTGSSGRGFHRVGFYSSAGVAVTTVVLASVFHVQVGGSIKDDHIAAVTAYQDSTGDMLPLDDACAGARERREGAAGGDAALLDDVISVCDRGQSRAIVGNAMQAITLVSAVAAGYFFYKGFVQKDKRGKERAAILVPSVSRESVGAQLMLRF